MSIDTAPTRTALAQAGAQPQNGGIASFIARMQPEIAKALPKHMDAERMARLALTVVRTTRGLEDCKPESFAGALLTCAQLGLEPGATGEAYLVPFGQECTLIIGYRGMAKLFWQSPLAKSLDAQVVYEKDHFEYEYGLEPRLEHRPVLGERGKAIAFYACAKTTAGGSAFVVLSPDDIEKIRKRSRAKNSGPWQTDYEAMAKKTCVRQLFKLLPISTQIGQALAQDGSIRRNLDAGIIDVDPADPDILDGELVRTGMGESDFDPETGEVLPSGTGVPA